MSYNEQLETNNASLEAVLLTLQSKALNTGGSGSGSLQVATTSGNSTAYTATVDGIDALIVGVHFVMIPHVTSGKTAPKLNVNGLGEKTLRMVNPTNSANSATPSNADWLRAGTPVLVMYNGTYWVTLGLPYISAESFNGVLPVSKGGTGVKSLEAFVESLGLDSVGGGENGLSFYLVNETVDVLEPTLVFSVDQIAIPEGRTIQAGDSLLACSEDTMCLYAVDSVTDSGISVHSVSYFSPPAGAAGERGYSIYATSTHPFENPDEQLEFSGISESGLYGVVRGDLILSTYDYTIYRVLEHTTSDAAIVERLCRIKGDTGGAGAAGERGTSVMKITTAPSSYATETGGFTPTYRVALSTVLSQAKISKVLVGDVIVYSYYHYQVGYVDSSYVYLGARTSIRGSTGAAGKTPVKGTDYYTDADKTEMVAAVKAAMPTFTLTGIDVNDVVHTWTLYGVQS